MSKVAQEGKGRMVVETRSERTVMRGDITDGSNGSNGSLRQYLPMWTYVYGMWGREREGGWNSWRRRLVGDAKRYL